MALHSLYILFYMEQQNVLATMDWTLIDTLTIFQWQLIVMAGYFWLCLHELLLPHASIYNNHLCFYIWKQEVFMN